MHTNWRTTVNQSRRTHHGDRAPPQRRAVPGFESPLGKWSTNPVPFSTANRRLRGTGHYCCCCPFGSSICTRTRYRTRSGCTSQARMTGPSNTDLRGNFRKDCGGQVASAHTGSNNTLLLYPHSIAGRAASDQPPTAVRITTSHGGTFQNTSKV